MAAHFKVFQSHAIATPSLSTHLLKEPASRTVCLEGTCLCANGSSAVGTVNRCIACFLTHPQSGSYFKVRFRDPLILFYFLRLCSPRKPNCPVRADGITHTHTHSVLSTELTVTLLQFSRSFLIAYTLTESLQNWDCKSC